MRVGVIGLGHMGCRVAQRLLEAGHDVEGWDRKAPIVSELARVQLAESPAALASRVDALFTVLADDEAVRSVVLDDAVLSSLREGALYADLSTTSPGLAEELAEAGREAGVDVLDVEMSGSTPQAEEGALVLLVGGDPPVLERMRPLLESISSSIVYMGGHGAGANMKLATNTLLGVGMQALAEAIAFGEAAGLDRGRLLDALAALAVVAPAHRPKLDNARRGEYPVAFALRLMDKDFRLVLAAAEERGVAMPATRASAEACAAALAGAREDVDFSVVIRDAERRLAGRR